MVGGGIWEGPPEAGRPELKCEEVITTAWQGPRREKGRQKDSLEHKHVGRWVLRHSGRSRRGRRPGGLGWAGRALESREPVSHLLPPFTLFTEGLRLLTLYITHSPPG